MPSVRVRVVRNSGGGVQLCSLVANILVIVVPQENQRWTAKEFHWCGCKGGLGDAYAFYLLALPPEVATPGSQNVLLDSMATKGFQKATRSLHSVVLASFHHPSHLV